MERSSEGSAEVQVEASTLWCWGRFSLGAQSCTKGRRTRKHNIGYTKFKIAGIIWLLFKQRKELLSWVVISLLIFFPGELSIVTMGVFKSATIIILLFLP